MFNLIKSVKDIFIDGLVKSLNDENKNRIYRKNEPLDVCYMVSPLAQSLEECTEFMEDITKNRYWFNRYEEDNTEGCTNGKIQILIEKSDEEKESEMIYDAYHDHYYSIEFTCDERYWGYCQCEPNDEGYNEENKCCGNGCDWTAPSFRIEKITSVGGSSWDGSESDYWEYENKFKQNEENNNKEVEIFKKKQEKERIEKQIRELQTKLASM